MICNKYDKGDIYMLNLVKNYKDVLDNSEVFYNCMDNSEEIIKKLEKVLSFYDKKPNKKVQLYYKKTLRL